MPGEVLEWLEPGSGQVFVDGTLGGGGHAVLLADAVGPSGMVIGIDRDPAAIERARRNLAGGRIMVVQGDYAELPEILSQLDVPAVNGILLDLGFSSDQLADSHRGFSFSSEGELDLRFDPTSGQPAWRLLERWSERELADVLFRYGEERYARRIARRLVERRTREPVRTAAALAAVVRGCVPRRGMRPVRGLDSATRTFQALRIAVNNELGRLAMALERMSDCLRPGGRLAVISYHSLEDRLVKQAFLQRDRYERLTRRPVRPGPAEVAVNPRSRSAKLRVARRPVAVES
jgi:16S rRNA (cytosine1402-N4)-methyltransferase